MIELCFENYSLEPKKSNYLSVLKRKSCFSQNFAIKIDLEGYKNFVKKFKKRHEVGALFNFALERYG